MYGGNCIRVVSLTHSVFQELIHMMNEKKKQPTSFNTNYAFVFYMRIKLG